jgi:4-hydroxybenzoate polyprenyltransferase
MHKWKAYWQLMRFHKPIGIALLAFPVWWALWRAYEHHPPISTVLVFMIGVVLTRAAGCIINDLCDRDIDGHVARTKQRPLAAQLLSAKEAYIALAVLSCCLINLLWFLNTQARWLAILAAMLTVFYPMTKRFFAFPQLILGITFNMGVLMVFAQAGKLFSPVAFLLYAASVVWTFTYDTIYALADQADDTRVGVRSSALSLGARVHVAIGMGYGLMCVLLGAALGHTLLSILCAGVFMLVYFYWLKNGVAKAPLAYFQYNAVLGLVVTGLIFSKF